MFRTVSTWCNYDFSYLVVKFSFCCFLYVCVVYRHINFWPTFISFKCKTVVNNYRSLWSQLINSGYKIASSITGMDENRASFRCSCFYYNINFTFIPPIFRNCWDISSTSVDNGWAQILNHLWGLVTLKQLRTEAYCRRYLNFYRAMILESVATGIRAVDGW